jgi:FkbM family methyltransferase
MLPQFVRELSYNSELRRIVYVLRLRKLLSSLYYKFGQRDQVLEVSAGGYTARFVSRNYKDLRLVESCAREAALTRLLTEVQPNDVMYDIGANRGLYTMLSARKVKQVIAFEPERESFGQLQENILLNGLGNVTAYREAISDHAATETLYMGGGVGMIDSGQLGREMKQTTTEVIDMVNGDAFVMAQRLPAPTVMKIDVEGYEGTVLDGFRKVLGQPECRMVCCEIHPTMLPQPFTKESIVERLRSFGFSTIHLYPHKSELHAFAYKEKKEH